MSERTTAASATRLGAVVIGRNEGPRLQRCLASLAGRVARVVYVDSGSSDDSVALARADGAEVVELDLARPFTAARARNAGFERLTSLEPDVEFVQFVDGDCELDPDWLPAAARALAADERLAVACGRRRERFPDASIYNLLCDMEWDTPVGDARACGGDALIRVSALRAAGGYNPALIAGEEPELCLRLRRAGWTIRRLDQEMTRHDAAIHRFGQWWRRAVRSGHAFADGAWRYGHGPERHNVRPLASILLWTVGLALAVLVPLVWTRGWSLLLLGLLARPWWSVYRRRRAGGRPPSAARAAATFTLLAKLPQLQGVAQFLLGRLAGRDARLIEYKSDTPRGKRPAILYLGGELPARTETFVYNEVFRLRARGLRVATASVRPPAPNLAEPQLAALAKETWVLYAGDLPRRAAGEALRHPLRAAATIALALGHALTAADVALRSRPRLLWQAVAALGLAGRARRAGITHIHAHMAHVPATVAMYAARQLGVPFSFTGHANDLFRRRTLLAAKLRRAAFCACISSWHRDFYRKVVALPDERLPLIRCGVSLPERPDPPTATPPTIVSVGRLIEKKGFDLLLEACARLPGDQQDTRVLIAGDGPQRDALARQARDLGLDHRVTWLGAQPNDAIRARLRSATLFVLPCRIDGAGDRDGIPVALMEAMAAGVCTVSGDLPAIRELIRDGESGRLTPPGDPAALAGVITRLLADPAERARLAAAGRARVAAEFSAEINTQRLVEAFERAGARTPDAAAHAPVAATWRPAEVGS